MKNVDDKTNFFRSIAELLQRPYKPNQYKDIMLSPGIVQRLDCVLEPTKDTFLEKYQSMKRGGMVQNLDPILNKVAVQNFHNASKFTFKNSREIPKTMLQTLLHTSRDSQPTPVSIPIMISGYFGNTG